MKQLEMWFDQTPGDTRKLLKNVRPLKMFYIFLAIQAWVNADYNE